MLKTYSDRAWETLKDVWNAKMEITFIHSQVYIKKEQMPPFIVIQLQSNE